jgi:uncharacterized protein YndB with AHSA1/START domain
MCYRLVAHLEAEVTDTIAHEITIDAPIDRVWELLTLPEHIARWYAFDGAEIDPRPGGRLAFRWREHGEYRGRIERIERPHTFSFRFVGHAPAEDPTPHNSTLVTFTLREHGGSTIVRVNESGFSGLIDPKEGNASKSEISLEGWRGGFEALAAYAAEA